MYKFNRVYRLLIGKSGGKGVEIKPPLHVGLIRNRPAWCGAG